MEKLFIYVFEERHRDALMDAGLELMMQNLAGNIYIFQYDEEHSEILESIPHLRGNMLIL